MTLLGHTAAGQTTAGHVTAPCDRESRVTRSLLGYGVIAGPMYVVVSLAQALTRRGFDLTRHAWSLLTDGDLGWIQTTDFVLAGLMTVALAVGLRRAGTGTWTPRLIGAYGVSLVAAGVFRADPALGFPPGTPENANTMSWHGTLHLLAGGIGFGCLIAACLVTGRAFAVAKRRGWAVCSFGAGAVLLAGFAGVASGSHGAWTTLPFTAAVVLTWAWVAALSVHVYRRVG